MAWAGVPRRQRHVLIYNLVLQVLVVGGLHTRENDVRKLLPEHTQSACVKQMERLYKGHVTVPSPPDITGDWTSSKCEVRPGPEFLVRHYSFFSGSHFELRQFYYSDALCRQPAYAIVARGRYEIYQTSWIVPGATEYDYHLSHVNVMPYTPKVAAEFSRKVNATCPGVVRSTWKPFKRHQIFSFVQVPVAGADEALWEDGEDSYVLEDLDCLAAIDLALHELQLMKLEILAERHHVTKSLLMGDIHTDKRLRPVYRPTGFQEPLLEAHTTGCHLCRELRESGGGYDPPTVPARRFPHWRLTGSWVSNHCESRPHGQFVTRHYAFADNNQTWHGHYNHFADGFCRHPMFSIYAQGVYRYGANSATVDGAREVDFDVTKAEVTPKNARVVNNLNYESDSARECQQQQGTTDVGKWTLGMPRDVTSVQGCETLGMRVPYMEHELVRLTKSHDGTLLYLGERPTDGERSTHPSQRPTSFQPPLTRCSDDVMSAKTTFHIEALTAAAPSNGAVAAFLLTVSLFISCLTATGRLFTT